MATGQLACCPFPLSLPPSLFWKIALYILIVKRSKTKKKSYLLSQINLSWLFLPLPVYILYIYKAIEYTPEIQFRFYVHTTMELFLPFFFFLSSIDFWVLLLRSTFVSVINKKLQFGNRCVEFLSKAYFLNRLKLMKRSILWNLTCQSIDLLNLTRFAFPTICNVWHLCFM